MANGLNKVILCGYLGADPELKHTQNGNPVMRMRIATTEAIKTADGYKDVTEWHTAVMWGKRAESLHRFITKGTAVWVEGRLQTRSWEDKNGSKHYSTEVVAAEIGVTGGPRREGGQAHAESAPADDADLDF